MFRRQNMWKSQYDKEFFKLFEPIMDTRQQEKVLHNLMECIYIYVAATLCGMDTFDEIWEWSTIEINTKWLGERLELKNGFPSRSTLYRSLNIIKPTQMEKYFVEWAKKMTEYKEEETNEKTTIAIDGKTQKGSKKEDGKYTHIVSAWCSENNLVIGQSKVDEKSNEITAIPELLDMLYIEGCVVTMDALGCQKDIVEQIYNDKKADYLINLKGNQGNLHKEVKEYFEDLEEEGVIKGLEKKKEVYKVREKAVIPDKTSQIAGLIDNNKVVGYYETYDKGHGRIELRKYAWSTDIGWIDAGVKKDWAGLTGIGRVISEVEHKDKKTNDIRYFIGSLDKVRDFAKSAREHWGVEAMHWNLDVTFRDDVSTIRKNAAPENAALIKRMCLNMLRNENQLLPKKSLKQKRIHASVDIEYRNHVFKINFG
jgi:predicted transposase YbfD/YdcC